MFSLKKMTIEEEKTIQKEFSKIFQNKRHIHRLKGGTGAEW